MKNELKTSEKMQTGWVKILRKLTEWEWYSDSHMVHLYIHLILKANHVKRIWRGITLERGQILTGRKKLSNETNIPERSIRTCLKRLQMTGEICIVSTNKYSIISICKYDNYQDIINGNEPTIDIITTNKLIHNRPTNNAVQNIENQHEIVFEPGTMTSNLTDKNLKKSHKQEEQENNIIPDKKFPIPTSDEVKSYCKDKGITIDPDHFCDYYSTNGWRQKGGNRIKDWKAAVRLWNRNQKSFNKQNLINLDNPRKILPIGDR